VRAPRRGLRAHLLAAGLPYERVELVLEGRARGGVAEGDEETAAGSVRTVHADGEGDDTIVARCAAAVDDGCEVTVATADRGLLARVTGLGVQVVGPRSVRG
jgi:rRNA-processing protein FCF1